MPQVFTQTATTAGDACLETHCLGKRVAGALRSCGFPALARVDVSADQDRIRLRGRVGSYYHKQLAQTIARQVMGGGCLVNDVQVDGRAAEGIEAGESGSIPGSPRVA